MKANGGSGEASSETEAVSLGETGPDDEQMAQGVCKLQLEEAEHQEHLEKGNDRDSGPTDPKRPDDDELAEIDLKDPELQKAALKIQSTFKGFKVRKTKN